MHNATAIFDSCLINTLRPRQNGHYFPDDIFECIFLKENVSILIKISLKFVPKSPINNIPALVQIMAWRRPGEKSLSEPMLVRLLTHICVTRPRWVNLSFPGKCQKWFPITYQWHIFWAQVNSTRPHLWLVNVGLGDGLVPLLEPVQTRITAWCL